MKQVVYVDILLTTNLFVNYFLLLSCTKLMKIESKRLRLFCGALVGAIASLAIFLPPMNFLLGLIFKLAVSFLIVYISFGLIKFSRFIKMFISFIAANFIFAGSMMGLWLAFKPGGMVINNNVVYFDISVPVLIGSTVVCYGIVAVVSKIISRKNSADIIYTVRVTFDSVSVTGKGYLDTGNALTDCFSGFPVIIANLDFIAKLFFDDEISYLKESSTILNDAGRLKNRTRIIPFGTIKEQGILRAFKPDYIIIEKNNQKICKTDEVYVALGVDKFSSFNCDVLLSPKVFESKEM